MPKNNEFANKVKNSNRVSTLTYDTGKEYCNTNMKPILGRCVASSNDAECSRESETIIIDIDNPYVKGLIKAMNEFMIEEASGCIYTELRLKNKIEKLQDIFREERRHMKLSGTTPVFGRLDYDKMSLMFMSKL